MTRRGFTLIELLVVIVIILVATVSVGVVFYRMSKPSVDAGARLLQQAMADAQSRALNTNAPAGIRLMPDPAFPLKYLPSGQLDPTQPLAANRIIPIEAAPEYTEGKITAWTGALPPSVANLPYGGPGTAANPNPTWGNAAPLMVYETIAEADSNGALALNSPTSWYWNIRIGDRIQIDGAGAWYTVVGPMIQQNPELFVNVGPAGTQSPFQATLPNNAIVHPEFLLLVNGRDDNQNGWIDEGFDGVDNNNDGQKDDIGEWLEAEAWLGALAG